MKGKDIDDIINTIRDAYLKPTTKRKITEQDIQDYIKSVGFLEDTLQFSRTAFMVIDCKGWKYLYCSANAKDVLGWEPEEFTEGGPVFGLTRLVHEDLTIQASIHPFMIEYLNALPEDEKPLYKFSFTSRLRKKNGQEVNLLQNNFFLRSDVDGQPLLKVITFTDISPYKKNEDVVFYISKRGPTARNEIVLQKCFSGSADARLTIREFAVIDASASGLSNPAIANKLNIRLNTVKNHKKNILRKLGCVNTSQMIALATLYGLISSGHPGNMRSKSSQNF